MLNVRLGNVTMLEPMKQLQRMLGVRNTKVLVVVVNMGAEYSSFDQIKNHECLNQYSEAQIRESLQELRRWGLVQSVGLGRNR